MGPNAQPPTPRKRWYEREPLAIFVPLSILAATGLQTIAYTGYKLFYNSFDVRPEEVGYDYASLFPRAAIPLALILAITLAMMAMVSVVLAFYGGMGVALWKARKSESSQSEQAEQRHRNLIVIGFAIAFGVLVVANSIGAPDAAIYALMLAGVGIVVAEHVLARDTNERSWLDVLFAPRIYRTPRRLILIVAAVALPTLEEISGHLSMADAAMYTALIFAFDRFLPVVAKPRDSEIAGGGTSPWLRRTGVVAIAGLAGTSLILLFALSLPSLGLNDRVREVRAGEPLVYKYDDLAVLAALIAEPRADRVAVRWIADNPPPLFVTVRSGSRRAIPLTYFGSNNGTSVFFAPQTRGRAGGRIYRWPTAAVAVEAIDTGREVS